MSQPSVRVLVVDDEAAIRRFLRVSLTAHGYAVSEAESGEAAMSFLAGSRPDLIILDLGLPGLSGLDVLRLIREWSRVPILILSVHDQEGDKIAALDSGADDYITKPFGIGELLARMRSALRRVEQAATGPVIRCGELVIDLNLRQVTVAGQEVQLTPTEYNLLRVLATQGGKVLTHRQLLREVWGAGYEQDLHVLRVNVSNLRRKIEPSAMRPQYILTEPGVGYRLGIRQAGEVSKLSA
jgi:two-component system KDP operon response regulator KdpE